MKKTIISVMMLMILIFTLSGISTAFAAEELVVYVSPNGDDSANGTIENPLRTVFAAKQKIQSKTGRVPVRVVFREGTYYMPDEGIKFTEKDSGTKSAPVSYEAYPGEEVVFSGGKSLDISLLTTVTDKEILEKVPENAHGKLMQLDLKKCGINQLDPVWDACVDANDSTTMNGPIYNFITLDGRRQMLSQWPNGDNNYESYVKVFTAGTPTSNAEIGYSGYRPTRWQTAKDAYVFCHPSNDYCSERIPLLSVNPALKSLKLMRGGYNGFSESQMSRIWKVFNLLEEIDTPTEWYIDRENMILYYYPPEKMTEDSVLEIAYLKDNIISFSKASFINLKGISFENTRFSGVHIADYSHDISVKECRFENIGLNGLTIRGDINDDTMRRWRGANKSYIDDPYNIVADKNIFAYIGHMPVVLKNRTIGEISSQNIYITNNYFTQTGWFTGTGYMLWGDGMGIHFENNLAHNVTGGGLNLNSYISTAKYNEMYNLCKVCSDVGLLYSCFNFENQDNEWAYNMLYSSRSKIPYGIQFSTGVYRDGLAGGTDVHHNFISDMPFGCTINGGSFNRFANNVLLDIGTTAFNLQIQGERFASFRRSTYAEEAMNSAVLRPGYAKRYPEGYSLIAQGVKYSNFNTVIDNIANKPIQSEIPEDPEKVKNYVIANNTEISDTSCFVDPEHMDFRLKDDSELAKKYPNALTESNFDIDKIGPQNFDFLSKLDNSFTKLYPENKAVEIDNTDAVLVWEFALNADDYVVTIAEDPDMKNVVLTETSHYNFLKVNSLDPNTTYYWKVDAVNNRRNKGVTWANSDEVFSFTTVKEELVSLDDLNNAIAGAKTRLTQVEEGVNYKEGAKKFISDAIEYAENAVKSGNLSRSDAKSVLLGLNKQLKDSQQYQILNFTNIEPMLSTATSWPRVTYATVTSYKARSSPPVEDTGEITYENGTAKLVSRLSSSIAINPGPAANDIVCFRAKLDTNNTWGGFSLRQSVDWNLPWNTSCYLVVLTEEQIELQKTGEGYLDSIASEGIFKSGEWHDYAFGATETMNGTRIIFMIDGRVIFDYLDTGVTLPNGIYSFFAGENGYNFEIQPAEKVAAMPEGVKMSSMDITEANYQGGAMSTDKLPLNTLLNFTAVMNTEGAGQALTLGNKKAATLDASSSYAVIADEKTVSLRKYAEGGFKVLAVTDNEFIKSGAACDISYGILSESTVNRILLYADGNKIFDYMDTEPMTGEICFAAYNLNGSGMEISAGKKTECEVTETDFSDYGVIKRWAVEPKISAEKTEMELTSHFTKTKVYYWHEVMEDGDPNATITLTLDLDTQQFGEEEYIDIPVDFTRGETGWKLLYVSDIKRFVVSTKSSGAGKIPQNSFLGRKSASTEELLEFEVFNTIDDVVVFAADSDKALRKSSSIDIVSNAKMVKANMLIPITAAENVFKAQTVLSEDGRSLSVNIGENSAQFTADSTAYKLNGNDMQMRIAPAVYDGILYVPLEGICAAAGQRLYTSSDGLCIAAENIPERYMLTAQEIDVVREMFLN